MTNSISPPYPKDLQILHDNNFINPIDPIFNIKLKNLKKKAFNANEVLTNQDIYLHNLNDVYYNNKIRQENITGINYQKSHELHEQKIKKNSAQLFKMFDNVLIKTSIGYYKIFRFFQKLTDNFFTIVNGNIGAIILAIIAFIIFIIIILWAFGIVNFDPNSSNKNDYDDFAKSYSLYSNEVILDDRRTFPQSIQNNNNIKFDFDQFKEGGVSYLYQYSSNNLQNSNSYRRAQASISRIIDPIKKTFTRKDTELDFATVTSTDRSKKITEKKYKFHDTFYLPIDESGDESGTFINKVAIIYPLEFDIINNSQTIDYDYKKLISKITNFSFNDLANIKIIFEKNKSESVSDSQFKIEKIISNNNKNIIFYDKNNVQSNNILFVVYNESENKITIKFNHEYFNYKDPNLLPDVNITSI